MRPSFWYRRRVCRRFVVGMALVAYLTTTVGMPLPVAARASGGMPFPCQDHVCGCVSAEQCWDHCCCYTPREKLAWAQEQGVNPPAALIAEVALTIDDRASKLATSRRSCCAADGHSAGHAAHAGKTCEHHKATGETSCDQHDHETNVNFLPAFSARKCRGLAEYWCLSGAVSSPPSCIQWQFQWNLIARLRLTPAPGCDLALSPPKRPPRV